MEQPSACEFYVAVNGSDSNTGSIDKPFASVQKAQQAVRIRRRDDASLSERAACTVFMRQGVFYLRETLVITTADSNTLYRAYGSGVERIELGLARSE